MLAKRMRMFVTGRMVGPALSRSGGARPAGPVGPRMPP
ncbi:hypothetical protein trd_A0203 (plasmid) [Thermomicrobium roseum DSM 5159]|uniref:Uncharacterized protein n=1 Tax=Thermomicrobium roseum (strain ATCC 27502 / DSM 5159 / P-2) TaxID=309801 RepID=B9L339_THERP|nr:hypothetical protein trd_A0203 [Thermomicrobium roseum DSM 5159]